MGIPATTRCYVSRRPTFSIFCFIHILSTTSITTDGPLFFVVHTMSFLTTVQANSPSTLNFIDFHILFQLCDHGKRSASPICHGKDRRGAGGWHGSSRMSLSYFFENLPQLTDRTNFQQAQVLLHTRSALRFKITTSSRLLSGTLKRSNIFNMVL